ncbi:MAG: S8 family serine peptidase [Planctomycetales bacterium]|nr:S8 family serine peptidase [Planctomycetales bacterium]
MRQVYTQVLVALFASVTPAVCLALPNDPFPNWGNEVYGANLNNAWDLSTGNSDQVVAVLSTGVNLTHSDLNLWKDESPFFSSIFESQDGFNAFNTTGRNPPADDHGIGTHSAGVIAAIGNNGIGASGVAYNAQIMPVKIARVVSGGALQWSIDNLIAGIDYVIRKKQEGNNVVAIHSFWNFSSDPGRLLEAKIMEAKEQGILYVNSAGDSALNIDQHPIYPASYDLPNLITVSAYYGSEELIQSSPFSNFGSTAVDVAAPGEIVQNTWIGNNGYQIWAGTSASAAYVAGTAALIEDLSPGIPPDEIKKLIRNSVNVRPELAPFVSTSGFLNAFEALRLLEAESHGDFNGDGSVDAADYTVWRDGLGTEYTAADYQTWRDNYGATAANLAAVNTPEPFTLTLVALACVGLVGRRRRI